MNLFDLVFKAIRPVPEGGSMYHGTRTEIVTYTKQYTRKGVRIVPLEVRALPGNSRGKARR